MRTPAQALRDAIASGAVEAWNRGGKIQLDTVDKTGWVFWGGDNHQTPGFSDPDLIWRPAPAKRRIPFTQATVPKGALWRMRDDVGLFFTASVYGVDGLILRWDHIVTWRKLAESFDYSIDGGATWQPGSMEVES